MERYLPTAQHTHDLGWLFGKYATPNTVITLRGDLGAGKTSFSKGVGEGLEVKDIVASPTYIVVRTHDSGRLPFWHADLYRIGASDELEQLGFVEQFVAGGVVVIEWPDRFMNEMPLDRVDIIIEEEGNGRTVRCIAGGPNSAKLLNNVSDHLSE
jgi:tRNA threonylcarbamoyladenosine biosynthesis protein TsaE